MLEDLTLGSNCPGANSWGKRNGFALRGERGTLNIEPLVRVDPGVNVLPNTFIKLVPRQAAIPFFACNPLYHMFPHILGLVVSGSTVTSRYKGRCSRTRPWEVKHVPARTLGGSF